MPGNETGFVLANPHSQSTLLCNVFPASLGLILDSFKAFARQRDSDFFGIQEVRALVTLHHKHVADIVFPYSLSDE